MIGSMFPTLLCQSNKSSCRPYASAGSKSPSTWTAAFWSPWHRRAACQAHCAVQLPELTKLKRHWTLPAAACSCTCSQCSVIICLPVTAVLSPSLSLTGRFSSSVTKKATKKKEDETAKLSWSQARL